MIVGALAAHALKPRISEALFYALNVAAVMQFFHAISLIIFSNLFSAEISLKLKRLLNIMIAGILLFSGSIYLLIIRQLIGMELLKFAAPLTPVGGILLIVSWFMLAGLYNKKK